MRQFFYLSLLLLISCGHREEKPLPQRMVECVYQIQHVGTHELIPGTGMFATFVDETSSATAIDKNGYLLTCFHCLGKDGEIDIKVDGKWLPLTIIKTDEEHDLALVHVDAKLHACEVCFDYKLGDDVYAVGDGFNLGISLKKGIISGSYENWIQADVQVNFGDSGGALFNARGELIGINDRIYIHNDGANCGVSFITPLELARPLLYASARTP